MGSVISALRGSSFPFTAPFHADGFSSQANISALESRYAGLVLRLEDAPLGAEADEFLYEGRQLIEELKHYRDCTKEIQAALMQPTRENEHAAWRVLGGNINFLRRAHAYGVRLEHETSRLLESLNISSLTQLQGSQCADDQPRAELFFAKISQFSFEFDKYKMSARSLQNDFSYYRRTLSRMRDSEDPHITEGIIDADIANQMSLFYAYPNPMFRIIINSATNYSQKNDTNSFLELLAALKIACANMLKNSGYDEETKQRALTILTASSILFDWIDTNGVFVPSSSINVVTVINAIKQHAGKKEEEYMDALRIHTKTLKGPGVPRKVKSMMGF
ncbi:hypothetical protein H4219_000105 [Mycoemilia scoparia]|uniref:CYRIA/CYRIB Rac1 binding domain-containing protein n=1 Tax=Mycoemilia scoparia TaxID=417184 RepID=A0A9W8A3T0_9FUNG|nr:hypothetical protein H4219_000105 [Mycoemilia scoparia]